ncbi:hypothetical protein [Streptomyces albipurpureus]|uniref:Uncharacterized protein n=1 Tax=Streptomyces albipurpureus TaxID=2897419 RepID=A0ABT0UI07_9ACTN|nr:hypothetical protein [Streptomyces sp. CWNU-1]MCM2387786.1 hypothetical protein [Streptomyces sp. CWNU-1]
MNDIKELLTKAVEDAGQSAVTTEAVYAGVAKARRRRGISVSAAVAVVVVAGLVATVVGVPGDGGGEDDSYIAAPSRFGKEGEAQAERLRKLLPGKIERVERVVNAPMRVNPGAEILPKAPSIRSVGPLDGQFLVTEKVEGKTTFRGLSITVMDRAAVAKDTKGKGLPKNFCTAYTKRALPECVREQLSNGQMLTTWKGSGAIEMGRTPWTYNWHGRLTLPDGGLLLFAEGLYAQDPKVMAIVRADHPPRPEAPRPTKRISEMSEEEQEKFFHELSMADATVDRDDFTPLDPKVFRKLMLRPELVPKN